MQKALDGLSIIPEYVLFDGKKIPSISYPSKGIIKGDSLSISIATASIIAKYTRDSLMKKYDEKWPFFGLSKHKGYGTKDHVIAMKKNLSQIKKSSNLYRFSFEPLKSFLINENYLP